jgi:hypothetical protein
MIIVKTKNGDRFINDKAVTMVEHEREKSVVNAYGDNGVFFHIEDVEGVTFISEKQPACISDEGSEVARLLKSCNDKAEYIGKLTKQLKAVKDDLLHFAFDMEQIVCHYHDQIPSDICKQIQTPALDLKSKVLNDKYRDIL